jgi:tetratricopeptide (TPR) repeat protein
MKIATAFAVPAGWFLWFTWMACGASTPAPSSSGTAAAPPPLPPSMGAATSEPKPPAGGEKAGPEIERAIAAIKAQDYRSAKAALEQALHKNPKNGTAAYYLGVSLENLGDKAGAEQKYKDAIANAPEIAEAAINLGALYLDQTKWDEAMAVTQKGLAKRPDDPALHANMAVALRGKGDKEGAAAEYERAVKVVGDNPELRYAYGALLLEMGNKSRAATELKGALAAAGSNRALLASIGRLLGPAGAYADCVSAFDRAIQGGDDPELRVRRGVCRHSLNDESGAKGDYEAAMKQNAKYAPAHYYLAESLRATGESARAIKEFEAAHALDPTSPLGKKSKEQADAIRKTAKATK